MSATTAIRANISHEIVKVRAEIKMMISEKEGTAIGRISDSRIVAEALAAYREVLLQKAS